MTAAQTDQAVLLKNDRVIQGKVEQRGDFYWVRIADQSQISLPAANVETVRESVESIYQYKTESIKRWKVGDHFQLTRWCLLNGLNDEAVGHYQAVAKQAGNHPRVKQLAIELQKKLLEEPKFREYLGLGPMTAKQTPSNVVNSSIPAPAPGSGSEVVPAGVGLSNTVMHPEIAARYSQKIQPILLNRCSQSACHGAQSNNGLRVVEPYARAFAEISSQNLKSVLGQVSDNPRTISPLLQYASTAHGIQRKAAISVAETRLLGELANWIQFVQNPVVQAVHSREEKNGHTDSNVKVAATPDYRPFSPAIALVPVKPGASGLRQVPRRDDMLLDENGFPVGEAPTLSDIEQLDRELRALLGEESDSAGRQSPPGSNRLRPAPLPGETSGENVSQDPFDPAEFNRQSKPDPTLK